MVEKLKEISDLLNGMQYRSSIDEDILNRAKENNIVIVHGASDDLMEFEGSIYDEVGVYDGGSCLVDEKGLLPNREDIDDDEELEEFFIRRKTAKKIEALWCEDDNYSFTYKTDIPHETFEVIEDDEKYCLGIVFSLDNLGGK